MIRFLLGALLLLSSLLPTPALAAGDPPISPPLNGQWRGPLKMLGGEIIVVITIVPLTNGAYYAALDAPQQRISRMPVGYPKRSAGSASRGRQLPHYDATNSWSGVYGYFTLGDDAIV